MRLHPLLYRFVELVISFPIKNMRVIHPEKVECYSFQISVKFNTTCGLHVHCMR